MLEVKNPPANAREIRDMGLIPGSDFFIQVKLGSKVFVTFALCKDHTQRFLGFKETHAIVPAYWKLCSLLVRTTQAPWLVGAEWREVE